MAKTRAKTPGTAKRPTRAPRWPRDRSEETPQERRYLDRLIAPLVKSERQGLIYLDVLTEAREPLTPEARDWAIRKLRVRLLQGFAGRREGAFSRLGHLAHEFLVSQPGATFDDFLAFLDQHANPHGPIIEANADAVTLYASEAADEVEVLSRAVVRRLFNRHRRMLRPPA